MNILRGVDIYGFWGKKDFSIPFHSDVNFLIGPNGSGKTTVINLVSAALSADFRTLDRLPFRKITLHLKEARGRKRPFIEINKKLIRKSPFAHIVYRISPKASEKPKEYSLDDIEEQRLLRRYHTRYQREIYTYTLRGVIEDLRKLVNVSWLSIHRSEIGEGISEEESYGSTVDKKLSDLSNQFVKYFSVLEKKSRAEMETFQETVFLSLLIEPDQGKLVSSVTKLDFNKEKTALIDIFLKSGLPKGRFSKRVEETFEVVKKAVQKFEKQQGLIFDELVALISTERIHSVVGKWNELIERQKEIYEPRETFLQVINNMMRNKQFQISDKNELEPVSHDGRFLSLGRLSSGEKQVLIFLGEALIQEKRAWIYVADEPELSLHVTWQNQLIKNLRMINPNCQIIFATHSPDIVSEYGNRVFNMEQLMQ